MIRHALLGAVAICGVGGAGLAQSDNAAEQSAETAGSDVPDAARQGYAPSALEERLMDINPCGGLSVGFGGARYGVNKIKRINVETADLTLEGDGVTFDVTGRLVCFRVGEAGEETLAADLSASLEGLLSTCEVTTIEVDLANAGGDLAWLLDMASPVIEGLVTNTVRDRAEQACEAL